jgi:hypothetical protein
MQQLESDPLPNPELQFSMLLVIEHLIVVLRLFQTFLDLLQELISVHQLMVYFRQLGVAQHVGTHRGQVAAKDHPKGGTCEWRSEKRCCS